MEKGHNNTTAKRYGMVIDLDKCTGCGGCMVACMQENNVPFKKDETDKTKSITWLRVYKLTNGKPYPHTEICYLPRPCQHCSGSWGSRTFTLCFGVPGYCYRLWYGYGVS
jgi:menaquinone reductase, iron-sulfur cluster-binding subunit